VEPADDVAVRAAEDARDLARHEVAAVELPPLRLALLDAHDDEVAVHRAFHLLAVDVDVALVAAENRAVAVGMNFDSAGVVRRELEKRVALAADREDDAVVLELVERVADFLARRFEACEAFVDVGGGEQTASALPQQINDGFVKFRSLRKRA
jgi:hypothetical protein